MKRQFVLVHQEARRRAMSAVVDAPPGYVITVSPPTRSSAANARMWALLTDVSEQVVWHGRKLSPEAWKHVFSSALKKQEVVPNIDGTGFVVLGQSTSQMTVGEMNELQVLIEAFGSQHGVRWSDELAHTKATA
jgi:hypothetical protein